MSMLKEFKAFAIKGNMVDMAVGIIIGTAFGKIVASLVKDIIMPPIGLIVGGQRFSEMNLVLKEAVGDQAAVTLNYGIFIQTAVDFLIIAFSVFMMVKAINSMKRKEEAAPPAPPKPSREEELLGEIRDLLKAR